MLYHLLMIFAPIIPHTVEEAWGCSPFKETNESAFLEVWEDIPETFKDETLEKEFDILIKMRDDVYPALEVLRRDKKLIGQNLDARIEFKPKENNLKILENHKEHLTEIFGVSQFVLNDEPKGEEVIEGEFGIWGVSHAIGKKCPRCWMWFEKEFEEVCDKCKTAINS